MSLKVGDITKKLRNMARPTMTWLGGMVCSPRALRVSDSTMTMRVKPVSMISSAGATDSSVISTMISRLWLGLSGLPSPSMLRLTEALASALPGGLVTALVLGNVGALTAAARIWAVVVVVAGAVVVVAGRRVVVVVGGRVVVVVLDGGESGGSAGAAAATAAVASQATRASRHAARARRPRMVGFTRDSPDCEGQDRRTVFSRSCS